MSDSISYPTEEKLLYKNDGSEVFNIAYYDENEFYLPYAEAWEERSQREEKIKNEPILTEESTGLTYPGAIYTDRNFYSN